MLAVLGFFICLAMAYWNPTIVGLDDYYHHISRFIPYPDSNYATILEAAATDIRSPYPVLLCGFLAKIAYSLGISEPANQLAFVRMSFAGVNWIALYLCARRIWKWTESDHSSDWLVALAFGTFFAGPFFFSRSMFETLSMPFLFGAVTLWMSYDLHGRRRDLLWGLLLVTIASIMRFQSGTVIIVPVALLLFKRQWEDLRWFSGLGIILLALSGLPELYWHNAWHGGLYRYVKYNMVDADFWLMPPHFFIPVVLGVALAPWWIFRWQTETLKSLGTMRVVWWSLIAFVFCHSLIGHKEERFMIPILPLILVLALPILRQAIAERRFWRLGSLAVVNFALLGVSFMRFPSNLFGALDQISQPEVVSSYEYNNSLLPRVSALASKDIYYANSVPKLNEGQIFFVRRDFLPELKEQGLDNLELVAEIKPNWIEGLLIKQNRRFHFRRDSIFVFGPKP